MNRPLLLSAGVASLVVALSTSTALAKKNTTPVTFFGIDYSLCTFIGSGDFADATQVTAYYPGVWNKLEADEVLEDVSKAVGPLSAVFEVVEASNARITDAQIIHEDGGKWTSDQSTITREHREALLKSYTISGHTGLGLVVIMDRLVKLDELGCGWIEYFDIESRSISAEARVCHAPSGFGFRNYWFRVVKDMTDDMKKLKP